MARSKTKSNGLQKFKCSFIEYKLKRWTFGELGQNYSGAGQAERAEVLEHHAQTNRHRERPKSDKKHGGEVNSLNGSLWATGQAYPYGETP